MNKKANCCTLMIVFAMIVAMITAPAGASDDGETFIYKTGNATVNVSGLNLRSGPGMDFAALASIGKSQAVKIVGQVGEWYAVYDYNSNQIGFVKTLKMIRKFRMKKRPMFQKMYRIRKI